MKKATKVKICGLKSMADIAAANAACPDYVGFVFAKSRRQIDFDTAIHLKSDLNSGIKAVGVFVNETVETIASLVKEKVIDVIQLHGYEDAVYMERLRAATNAPIIKAVRVQSAEQIQYYGKMPCDYLLLDTYVKGERGGSGQSFDWSMIPKLQIPYFLAGGLNSQNVLTAVETLHPYCVDVSSGVETEDKKDREKMAQFVEQVRSVK